jgi:hypothetical protein
MFLLNYHLIIYTNHKSIFGIIVIADAQKVHSSEYFNW